MRSVYGILSICFCLIVAQALIKPVRDMGVEPAVAFFKEQSGLFAASTEQLRSAITAIKANDSHSVIDARKALVNTRISFKRIEFFLEYFFTSSAMIYNRAAKYEIEEPHDPAKHFTDGLTQSKTIDGRSHVQRNASSLLYAGYQYGQFWDGRAKSLEEQVKTVMNNKEEMDGGEPVITALLARKPYYKNSFATIFPAVDDSVTIPDKVAMALAAFVRSLNPRNARFDQYLQGNTSLMNAKEINGFNLFMGKAQCGTCHFAPLFNGLTPPLYNLSELEVLGTTNSDNFEMPVVDSDEGRFKVFPIGFYDKAFKTPTVRNVSATGPYMHNGAFKTLEAVIEFYNKGGAAGMGLSLPNQTLSAQPLNLTKEEVSNIESFLHTLEDEIPNSSNHK